MAPHTQLAHSWSYCVDRVVNYLLLGRLMKSYVFFSLAAAHLTLPSHLPPIPPSVSSVFCVSPSSWNSSTRLARKIGHPLVLLSPLQHSKKIILWGVLCHFVMSKPQSPEYSQNTQKTHMHTYQLKEGGKNQEKIQLREFGDHFFASEESISCGDNFRRLIRHRRCWAQSEESHHPY